MRVLDARLPGERDDDQWSELLFHTARPEDGKQWTATGEVHEKRGLNGRVTDDTRVVPCRTALTKILREHIASEKLKPGDLIFPGERWPALRKGLPAGLTDRARESPRPEWARSSVPVLLARCARSISGQLTDHQKRIGSSGDLLDLTAEG